MWKVEDKFGVILGGNTYINVANLVTYKGEPLFTLKRRESDGQLGIDFDIFDVKGVRIATIRGNRIVQGAEDNYEIIRETNRYAVVEKATGKVICDIRRRTMAPNSELEVSVELYTSWFSVQSHSYRDQFQRFTTQRKCLYRSQYWYCHRINCSKLIP